MRLEFYISGKGHLIAAIDAESCPDVGEKISIRKATWLIVSRSWAVDHADELRDQSLRVCLNCGETNDELM